MSRSALRIIDANANRAREALRVMEDAARFLLDDADLCTRLKSLRHRLSQAVVVKQPGGALTLAAWRDTPGDAGTSISNPGERSRGAMRDVVVAAGKRLTEALRSIEESLKTVDPHRAAEIEQIRYESYDIDAALTLAMGSAGANFAGWRLCLLLTESLCADRDWQVVASQAIEGGVDCIQLREKSLTDADLLGRARTLVALGRDRSVDIIINDRPDIALIAGATGVHLGQVDMSVCDARRITGGGLLIGVSTSNINEARSARVAGADYCGVGPMFPSTTKHKSTVAGPGYLGEYLSADPPLPPCLAISGITQENVPALVAAADGSPFGVAVSSAICAAERPAEAARAILRAVQHDLTQQRSGAVETRCP